MMNSQVHSITSRLFAYQIASFLSASLLLRLVEIAPAAGPDHVNQAVDLSCPGGFDEVGVEAEVDVVELVVYDVVDDVGQQIYLVADPGCLPQKLGVGPQCLRLYYAQPLSNGSGDGGPNVCVGFGVDCCGGYCDKEGYNDQVRERSRG